MHIPKEKDKQVRMILDKLAQNGLPRGIYTLISGWLISGDSKEEKERQLAERFDKDFSYTARPSKEAYRSFNDFARRNGLAGATLARIPLRRRMAFKVAAVLIPLFALAGGAIFLTDRADTAEHAVVTVSVPAGDIRTVTLPDDTRITVSGNSEIVHAGDFKDGRSVKLRGEAHFNVTKASDEGDSFTVHTRHFKIAVLGTEFRVHSYEDRDSGTIDLYEGSIDVEVGGERVAMKPGEHLFYDCATKEMTVTRIALQERTYKAMTGFVFNETPLAEVFGRLESEYGVSFTIEGDISALHTAIRGDLSALRSLDDVMRTLQMISGQFTYEITDNEIIVRINDIE